MFAVVRLAVVALSDATLSTAALPVAITAFEMFTGELISVMTALDATRLDDVSLVVLISVEVMELLPLATKLMVLKSTHWRDCVSMRPRHVSLPSMSTVFSNVAGPLALIVPVLTDVRPDMEPEVACSAFATTVPAYR